MAQTLSAAQRTHTDKTLARTEDALNTVRDFYTHDTQARQRFSIEIAEIRRQRRALDHTTPTTAHKWATAANKQWSTLRRKHPGAFTPVPSPTVRAKSASQRRREQHQDTLQKAVHILIHRRRQLSRAARVTSGQLHAAITAELADANNDLASLNTMSHTTLRKCLQRHTTAMKQWNDHGAEAVLSA